MKFTTHGIEVKPSGDPISIRLGAELAHLVAAASKRTGLSKADLLRLAAKRGMPIVVKQITGARAA